MLVTQKQEKILGYLQNDRFDRCRFRLARLINYNSFFEETSFTTTTKCCELANVWNCDLLKFKINHDGSYD